ncbi:MAG: hypothetical protein GF405_09210, partial [Candidatus Eisenbacteria bacterium]|nr:hypothetical protein [Candidatus Eisenbacteria bacterium]
MATTRFRSILVLCLLAVSAVSATAAAPSIELVYSESAVELRVEGSYERPLIDGCRVIAPAGAPAVPARVLTFVIPDGMRVADVVVRTGGEVALPGRHRVLPVQAEVP